MSPANNRGVVTMNTLLQAIVNVAGLLPALTALLVFISFVSGILMVMKGLGALAKPANSSGVDRGYIFTHLLVGVVLITLGSFIYNMMGTFFGSGEVSRASAIFSYAPSTLGTVTDGTTRTVLVSIVGIIQFIGLIAIIRSMFLFAAYSKQAIKSIGSPITFLISGIFAMNFPVVVGAFSALFT